MANITLTLRLNKQAPLTYQELDENFSNLREAINVLESSTNARVSEATGGLSVIAGRLSLLDDQSTGKVSALIAAATEMQNALADQVAAMDANQQTIARIQTTLQPLPATVQQHGERITVLEAGIVGDIGDINNNLSAIGDLASQKLHILNESLGGEEVNPTVLDSMPDNAGFSVTQHGWFVFGTKVFQAFAGDFVFKDKTKNDVIVLETGHLSIVGSQETILVTETIDANGHRTFMLDFSEDVAQRLDAVVQASNEVGGRITEISDFLDIEEANTQTDGFVKTVNTALETLTTDLEAVSVFLDIEEANTQTDGFVKTVNTALGNLQDQIDTINSSTALVDAKADLQGQIDTIKNSTALADAVDTLQDQIDTINSSTALVDAKADLQGQIDTINSSTALEDAKTELKGLINSLDADKLDKENVGGFSWTTDGSGTAEVVHTTLGSKMVKYYATMIEGTDVRVVELFLAKTVGTDVCLVETVLSGTVVFGQFSAQVNTDGDIQLVYTHDTAMNIPTIKFGKILM